ncbi:hypothetical protein niasHT_000467 [Heterodera trifolii]|uniref:Peptidase S1 domain-containing protein n=1 Tax=Heterodera trifolii TaxID=157864 RepID=A0ABD2IYY7_9BILA
MSDNFLTINEISPNPKGFYKEFFEESKLGSFLEEYVGLWLLTADIMPNLRQKLTKLIFMVPDKCRIIRVERHPQNCTTFDQMAFEKKHRSVRQINPLISGGAKIDIKHMPWVVYFMGVIQTNLFETKMIACTASLISPKFVLLAAHCFDEVAENKLILLGFGSNSRDLTSKKYVGILVEFLRLTDLNVFIHPMYNKKLGINDLALIKMDENVEFSSTIFPICIHCGAREIFEEGKAYIAGWGYLKNSCTQKTQKGPLTLMGRSAQLVKCKKSFFNDGQDRICIEKNTIEQGDSGGPLLATNGTNFVQIGVASGGLCNSLFGTSILNIYSPLDGCWIEKIADVQCGI